MKQKLAAIALLLCGFALVQTQMSAIDPSGMVALRQLKQHKGNRLPETGLIADPTGTATVKAGARAGKP